MITITGHDSFTSEESTYRVKDPTISFSAEGICEFLIKDDLKTAGIKSNWKVIYWSPFEIGGFSFILENNNGTHFVGLACNN